MSRFDVRITPSLADVALRDVPAAFSGYSRDLSSSLRESVSQMVRALNDIDTPPMLQANLAVSQSVGTTAATLVFDSVTDTHGWYSSGVYTPQLAGFYRCSWSVNFHEPSVAFPVACFGVAQLYDGATTYAVVGYGNGTALDIPSIGDSVLVECDGASTPISVQVYRHSSATAPVAFAGRCRLSIEYVGRRPL